MRLLQEMKITKKLKKKFGNIKIIFMEIQNDMQKIIDLFMSNVKDKEIIFLNKHCGSEGHWLEEQMGIKRNSKNEPDIFGYEMKKN